MYAIRSYYELKFGSEQILIATNELRVVSNEVRDQASIMNDQAEVVSKVMEETYNASELVKNDLNDVLEYMEQINRYTGGVKNISVTLGETSGEICSRNNFV